MATPAQIALRKRLQSQVTQKTQDKLASGEIAPSPVAPATPAQIALRKRLQSQVTQKTQDKLASGEIAPSPVAPVNPNTVEPAAEVRPTNFTGTDGKQLDSTESVYNPAKSVQSSTVDLNFLNAETPKMGENEDPRDYQVRVANFNASQFKKSFEEQEKLTEGIQEQDEVETGQSIEDENQQRAGELKTKVNPAFTALSETQKILNEQRKAAGEDYVKETISDESGRAAINDNMSREDKEMAANLVNRETKRAQKLAGDEPLPPLDPTNVVVQNYNNYKRRQQEKASQVSGDTALGEDLAIEEKIIRDSLGMQEGDELTFREDGTPLVNGKTESENAKERARKKSEEARQKGLSKMNTRHGLSMGAMREAYTVNGVLSDQGARVLAEEQRAHDERIEDFETQVKDNLEDNIKAEQKRNASVMAKNRKTESVQAQTSRRKSQEAADGAVALQREYAAKGKDVSFTAALSEWTARQKYVADKPEKDPTQKELFAKKVSELDEAIKSPQHNRSDTYNLAVEMFDGDTGEAAKYMKSRAYRDEDIKAQKEQFQIDTLGYTEADLAEEEKSMAQSTRIERAVTGKASQEEINSTLDLLSVNNPELGFRLAAKIDDPTLQPEDIDMLADAQFRPKTAKSSTGSRSSSKKSNYSSVRNNIRGMIESGELDANSVNSEARAQGLGSGDSDALEKEFALYNRSDGAMEFRQAGMDEISNSELPSNEIEDIFESIDVVESDLDEEEKVSFWKNLNFFGKDDTEPTTGNDLDDIFGAPAVGIR